MGKRPASRIAILALGAVLLGASVSVGLVLHEHSVVELKDRRIARWAERHGFEERAVRSDDFRVRYWVGGEGEPLLLVHGFSSYGTWNWSHQMRTLDGYRLVVPDLPGFGESWVHEGAEPGLELQAEALRAVLDAEEIDRTHAVGTSYGGFAILTLATETPERVDRIALVGSPGHTYTHADHEAMLARLEIDDAEHLFLPPEVADLRVLLGAATRLPARLVPRFLLVDLYEDLVMTQERTKAALVADLERRDGMPTPPLDGEEVLVVWGPRDGLFPLEVGERLAADLDARFVVLKRTSHRPHAERPARFNRVLVEFLADGEAVARR